MFAYTLPLSRDTLPRLLNFSQTLHTYTPETKNLLNYHFMQPKFWYAIYPFKGPNIHIYFMLLLAAKQNRSVKHD